MTQFPPNIITTEELEREEWLLKVIDCQLTIAKLAASTDEDFIVEFGSTFEEIKALAVLNQTKIRVLTDLRAKLIARRNEQLSKTVYHLGGTA